MIETGENPRRIHLGHRLARPTTFASGTVYAAFRCSWADGKTAAVCLTQLSSSDLQQVAAVLGAVLDETAAAADLTDLAADVLSRGVHSAALLDLATTPAAASMSDVCDLFFRTLDELGLPRLMAHPRVLQYLVDNDEIDSLLSVITVEQIAAEVLASYREEQHKERRSTSDDPNWWAIDVLWNQAWTAVPERPRRLLRALVEQASTDWELARIGAGPLEDFVSDDPDDLEWLETQLRRSAGFRRALAGAWIYNQVTPDTFERLNRLVGQTLGHPDRA